MQRFSMILGAVILLCTIVVTLGSLITLYRWAPRGGGPIVGFSIGDDYPTVARIPRQALACVPGQQSDQEICRYRLDDAELMVTVRYNPQNHLLFADCQASYRSSSSSCTAGSYTLGGGIPIYARMSATNLGIPATTLVALRQTYPWHNYYEADWQALAPRFALLVGIATALGMLLLVPVRWFLRLAAAACGWVAGSYLAGIIFYGLLVLTGLID